MGFGRDSWLHIQDNRMIIMYMFISVIAFVYIYHITAKSPIKLQETVVKKEGYEEQYSMPMNHLKNTNYNTQDFANTRQQHHDPRDMASGLPPSGFV